VYIDTRGMYSYIHVCTHEPSFSALISTCCGCTNPGTAKKQRDDGTDAKVICEECGFWLRRSWLSLYGEVEVLRFIRNYRIE
jgi:hypothetical protein